MGDFNYEESVTKVRTLFIKWKTISLQLLQELYEIKKILVAGRKAGRPQPGERSWADFVREAVEKEGGPARKTIDAYLDRFEKWMLETGGKGAEEDFRAWADEQKQIAQEKKARREEAEEAERIAKGEEPEPEAKKVVISADSSKIVIQNVVRHKSRMTFDIFLPEYNKTYTRTIYLEGSRELWPR